MTRKTGYCPQHGEVQGEPDALCPLQCEEYLEPMDDYEGAGYGLEHNREIYEVAYCPQHGDVSLDENGVCTDCLEGATVSKDIAREPAGIMLESAISLIDQRGEERDQDDGERSMARTVQAFNALYGHNLTETEGWQFMALLKQARSAGGCYKRDDYLDQVAYAALAGEAASKGD